MDYGHEIPQPVWREGVCNVNNKLGQLSKLAWVKAPSVIKHESKTKFHIVSPQNFGYQLAIHSSCVCNELQAIYSRHCIDRSYLAYDNDVWKRAARAFDRVVPYKHLERLHPLEIIKGYSGAKRKNYYGAWLQLAEHGLKKQDTYVSMFIKPDRYSADQIKSKAPRAIQFRSMEYNIMFATYLKPVEEWLYAELAFGVSNTRIICKGLSPMGRAHLFREKLDYFEDPIYLELDHSKFDSTIRVEHLRSCHKIYKKFVGRKLQFHQLCEAQINNKCFSKGGIRYGIKGTRMSGDFDTGLGNSIINAICLYGFLQECGIMKFDIILDGDDSVIIIERGDELKCQFEIFESMGFETKHFIKYNIHKVDFCQCRYMDVPQPNFVRNPIRAISHSTVKLGRVGNRTYREWAAGVGMCELSLNQGIPVLQILGYKLARSSQRYYLDQDTRFRMGRVKLMNRLSVITDEARCQFWECWGIDPSMQEEIESQLTGPTYFGTRTKSDISQPEYGQENASVWGSGTRFCAMDADIDSAWRTVSQECL